MRKFTKRSAALVTAGVIVATGGAAWAVWGVTGTGSVAASGATISPLVVGQTITLTPTAFFPGSKHNIAFTVSNPNPFPVDISGISLTITSNDTNACASNNVVQVPGAEPSATSDISLDANSGTHTITYVQAVRMIANAAPGCAGNGFQIGVQVAANSAAVDD
ncbi:hypothetical protein [Actinoplanes subglobosus]|uniref:Uncharacterized protein n=1 Tax=Actinoplanes subglobosus TaxID=1547892 RepID=A0ABV8IW97_9ACTN